MSQAAPLYTKYTSEKGMAGCQCWPPGPSLRHNVLLNELRWRSCKGHGELSQASTAAQRTDGAAHNPPAAWHPKEQAASGGFPVLRGAHSVACSAEGSLRGQGAAAWSRPDWAGALHWPAAPAALPSGRRACAAPKQAALRGSAGCTHLSSVPVSHRRTAQRDVACRPSRSQKRGGRTSVSQIRCVPPAPVVRAGAARAVGRRLRRELEGHLDGVAPGVDAHDGRVGVAAVEHAALGGRLAADADHDLHAAAEHARHLRAGAGTW